MASVRGGSTASPQVVQRVRAPRPPRSARPLPQLRVTRRDRAVEGVADAEVGGQEHVGIAERPHRDVARRPRPDAGQREQSARHLARSAPASSTTVRRRRARVQSADERAARGRRHRQPLGIEVGERRRGRERWVSVPTGRAAAARRLARRARPASVRAPATDTCWPSTARTASSAPSTWAGERRPGPCRDQRRRARIGAEAPSTATGSASRSSSRRQRCTAA